MPGIAGIVGKSQREENSRMLGQMLKSMRHEEFYLSGSYDSEEIGVWAGWVGYESSVSPAMPIWNDENNICLIFSGEDFSEQVKKIVACHPGDDIFSAWAKSLVNLYEEGGLGFLSALNGWFSGVLVDLRKKYAVIFSDRYGMHRIFFHESKNNLYFASEAKALLAVVPETRAFDPKGVGELLTCGCTLGSRSLFKDISVLPGGSFWIFEEGRAKSRGRYFSAAEWAEQDRLDEKRFSARVLDLFGELIPKYCYGNWPVGISLTAGLDSRIIMACLKPKAGESPCYTFGSIYRDTYDVKIAREVAKACGKPHDVLVLGEKFLEHFPKYLEKAVYISDGYLGMSGAAELYLNGMARTIAPVRVTGNYGGELMRGHRTFKYEAPKGCFFNQNFQFYLQEAKASFREFEKTDGITFSMFRQAPMQGYGRRAIESSQVVLRTPFMDNDLVQLAYQAPPGILRGAHVPFSIITHYWPDLLGIATERGLMKDRSTTIGRLRQLYRKALIKGEYWSSHGMPHWVSNISSYGVGGFLEKRFLGRDKFQHFSVWTRKRFADYLKCELYSGIKKLESFYDYRQATKIINHHIDGGKNYLDEIDKMLTLVIANKLLLTSGSKNPHPNGAGKLMKS